MLDTPIGRSEKSDPAEVAEQGYAAMMKGAADVVSGWRNKLIVARASITPAKMLAEQKSQDRGTGYCQALTSAGIDAADIHSAGR